MELVLSIQALSWYGGSESYLLTVAEQLQRLGHGVTVFAPAVGEMAEIAEERGLRVVTDEQELPAACDVVYAQESITALTMAGRYPDTPLAYAVHADGYELSVPPQVAGLVSALVVMYDRTQRMAEALAVAPKVVRLRQPVDADRFAPRGPLREPPRRALLIGNYVWGDRRELVARSCSEAGIELVEAGYRAGRFVRDTSAEMGEVDIVFGKARVIVEALAAGRAAYVYDHNGGDGWVTAESYERLEADNFGGQVDPEPIDHARLRRDLAAYSPQMGLVNRDLAVRNHSANKHAQALVAVFRGLAPRAEPDGVPYAELARLTRLQWSTHGQVHALTIEAQDVRERLAAAEERSRSLHQELMTVRSTRRYRFANALARPLYKLRDRRHGSPPEGGS